MSDLPLGVYEQLVTNDLDHRLRGIDPSLVDRDPLDHVDGHRAVGTAVHLFIRETKEADGDLGAPPYLYAGPATYVRHSNDRPIQILWKLDVDLPADVFHAARVAI